MKAFEAEHYWLEAIFRHDDPEWDASKYPFDLPVLKGLDRLEFHPKVTVLVGENGSGKSTLIEALAVAWGFNAEGGSKNFQFSTHESHSHLHKFVRTMRSPRKVRDGFYLRAETFYNAASYINSINGQGSYGGEDLHQMSHGESFFALFENRFTGHGLYILDEPEAALSPARQLSFLTRMHQLISERSQFIIATHSPILLGYPDAKIYQISKYGLEPVSYEETEHYQITRQFMNNRQSLLDILLTESPED